MVILTAENLTDTHPEVPEDFRTSMRRIRRHGGPWDCPSCGKGSLLIYRCTRCGTDLA